MDLEKMLDRIAGEADLSKDAKADMASGLYVEKVSIGDDGNLLRVRVPHDQFYEQPDAVQPPQG